MIKRITTFFILLIPLLLWSQVTIQDTTINWRTFNYELNVDNTLNWVTDTEYDTVTQKFSGKVIENKYLRVTLLPEYGGRILSMIYKPTGHEQLYRNPAGLPYGHGDGNFYYDWLMVYGGIFPTFPESEHSKAWLLPWKYEELKISPDTVRIKMSWQDTVALGEVGKFWYGRTDLKCDYIVTLVRGENALRTDVSLINDKNEEVAYEYWTCTTLAPGSNPEDPGATGATEMVMPYSKIEIMPWWNLQSMEEPIDKSNNIYKFDKLKYYKNWVSDGIIYPRGETYKNYWGVINHDNEEGLIRVSENDITSGIKIWCWEYSESIAINPLENPNNPKRPYLELWAGHSNKFGSPTSIDANSQKQWEAIYIPTEGLSAVNSASREIVANYYIDREVKLATLQFVTIRPDIQHRIEFTIVGSENSDLQEETLKPAAGLNTLKADLSSITWSENDSLNCKIYGPDETIYFNKSILIDSVNTEIAENDFGGRDFKLAQNYPNPFNSSTTIEYQLTHRAKVRIDIYNIQGQKIKTLINRRKGSGIHQVNWKPRVASGVYYYRINAHYGNHSFNETKKLIYLK